MAILTTMRLEGDPDELLADKQRVIDPIAREQAKQNGGLEHITVKTPDGLMVINIWESEEGMEKTSEAMRPVAEAENLTEPSDWQQFEIVQREVLG